MTVADWVEAVMHDPRALLAYADWLDEHGMAEQGSLVHGVPGLVDCVRRALLRRVVRHSPDIVLRCGGGQRTWSTGDGEHTHPSVGAVVTGLLCAMSGRRIEGAEGMADEEMLPAWVYVEEVLPVSVGYVRVEDSCVRANLLVHDLY